MRAQASLARGYQLREVVSKRSNDQFYRRNSSQSEALQVVYNLSKYIIYKVMGCHTPYLHALQAYMHLCHPSQLLLNSILLEIILNLEFLCKWSKVQQCDGCKVDEATSVSFLNYTTIFGSWLVVLSLWIGGWIVHGDLAATLMIFGFVNFRKVKLHRPSFIMSVIHRAITRLIFVSKVGKLGGGNLSKLGGGMWLWGADQLVL